MTWTRHRPKALSWALVLAFVLVIVFTVRRYTSGGVAVSDDLVGLVLRLAVLVLIAVTYLRIGGSTTVSADGLVVHNGVRALEIERGAVTAVREDPRRGGAVAVLGNGRAVELPGVPMSDVATLRKRLKRR